MYQIISQIIIYITIAAIIGFIIGWLFSKLIIREKSEELVNIAHDELARVKAKKNELEDELITKSSQFLQISADNNNIKKNYLSMEMDYEELLKKSTDIDPTQIQRLEDEKSTLEREVQKSKAIINRLNESMLMADKDMATLKERVGKTNQLQTNLKRLEEDRYQFLNNIDKLQGENRFLIEKLNLAEKEKTNLHQELKNIKQTSTKNSDVAILENKITSLQNMLDNSKESELRKINEALITKVTNLENNNLLLIKKVEEVKEEKSKLSLNIDSIRDKITQTKLEEYNTMKVNISNLQEKNNTLVMKLASFQEDNMGLKTIINDLNNNLATNNTKDELNTLKQKLEDYNQIKSDIDKLQEKNSHLVKHIFSIEKESRELKITISKLNNKIKGNSIANNLTNELNTLRDELKHLNKLKEEKNIYIKSNSITDVDNQVHILDKNKILNFKMDNSYISKIFKD